jgi:hypothetical protein
MSGVFFCGFSFSFSLAPLERTGYLAWAVEVVEASVVVATVVVEMSTGRPSPPRVSSSLNSYEKRPSVFHL